MSEGLGWVEERQNVRVGTMVNQDSGSPVTVLRDWDTIVIPACRLDAASRGVLRKILQDEEPMMAAVHGEIAEDTAGGEAGG